MGNEGSGIASYRGYSRTDGAGRSVNFPIECRPTIVPMEA